MPYAVSSHKLQALDPASLNPELRKARLGFLTTWVVPDRSLPWLVLTAIILARRLGKVGKINSQVLLTHGATGSSCSTRLGLMVRRGEGPQGP